MPLYLDDTVTPPMPSEFLQALLNCDAEIGQQPVNPAMVIRLLRTHLSPLLPDEHKHVLDVCGQTSWDSLWTVYAHLASASEGVDKKLRASADLTSILLRNTTRPPRTIEFPTHLEVVSFVRMATRLGLPVANPRISVRTVDLSIYSFCRYCWMPQSARGLCRHHSSQAEKGQTISPLFALATPKKVQRLRPQFEKQLLRLVSAEEWEFHDSGSAAAIMLPPSGLGDWLKQRRPALAQLMEVGEPSKDNRSLSQLIAILYGDLGPPVAKTIGGSVHLLTPITARAEAWLCAWQGRAGWGGSRSGAGRRPVQRKNTDAELGDA